MKIETVLHPNCSEYTIYLRDLKPNNILRIKELELDLKNLYDWSHKERLTLPKEPPLLEPDAATWSMRWDKWKKLDIIKKFHAEDKKRWNQLKKKYVTATGESIFDTSIRRFNWTAKDAVQIAGYLNESELVAWLNDVVKVDKIEVHSAG